MIQLKFKNYLESLGSGSFLPTTWTNSEADPTMGLAGHPMFLPGLDFVMNNGEEGVPQTTKKAIVKHFLFKQNPITIELVDGTKLLMTLDQYKRITGDLPIIPNYTQVTVVFQRSPQDLSNNASQIASCKAQFIGPDYLRKHYKVGYTYKP